MSTKDFTVDVPKLDKWIDWLNGLADEDRKKWQSRVMRSVGLRVLERTQDGTPVRTGRLKQSFSMGAKGNVFRLQIGDTAYVFIGTAVEYAEAIEEGFEQKAGRFVPGYWSSGTFHYVPYAEAKAKGIGGMVLKGKVIPGAHMMKNALDATKNEDMAKIVEFEFRRLYAELFKGA